MSDQTIGVTGASGFVGRHIVRTLLSRGHRVRALTRDRDKGRRVLGRHDALEIVEGDVLDDRALDRLLTGATGAIHLVGIIREASGGQTFERMHVGATDAVIEACARHGVRRYLHMSALGVGAEGICDYQRTKYRAETLVRRSSLEWTIFRPGLIHGAEGEVTQMVAGWTRGQGMPAPFLPYFSRSVEDTSVVLGPVRQETPVVAPVSVEDVAHCFAEALERPQAIGEIYNLAGPDRMRFPEMLIRIRDAVPGSKNAIHTAFDTLLLRELPHLMWERKR